MHLFLPSYIYLLLLSFLSLNKSFIICIVGILLFHIYFSILLFSFFFFFFFFYVTSQPAFSLAISLLIFFPIILYLFISLASPEMLPKVHTCFKFTYLLSNLKINVYVFLFLFYFIIFASF